MGGNPPQEPDSAQRLAVGERSASGERAGQRLAEPERIGPITIARHVKADGRALILYTHDAAGRT
jgi:hypothetical protein